jgi:hypothetical protein
MTFWSVNVIVPGNGEHMPPTHATKRDGYDKGREGMLPGLDEVASTAYEQPRLSPQFRHL